MARLRIIIQSASKRKALGTIYKRLEARFGDLGWWPADTSFEVVLGAILTQNTSWTSVEKAINSLKRARLMSPERILKEAPEKIGELIRPSGYFRIKTERLKAISRFLMDECDGKLAELRRKSTLELRGKLLAVKGVGPETADSILLYALGKPVFVVDAYTKRIFFRHGLIKSDALYDEVRSLVMENFPNDTGKFNQFHALLVETAKSYCKKSKRSCGGCPLGKSDCYAKMTYNQDVMISDKTRNSNIEIRNNVQMTKTRMTKIRPSV